MGRSIVIIGNGAREALGRQSPESSYWVLMTKDVLPGHHTKSYKDQCALVARHQGYTVPGALESAVVMLLHHVRSGERLYSDSPWTFTRCWEKVQGVQLVVGGFSSVGLDVNVSFTTADDDSSFLGLLASGSLGSSTIDKPSRCSRPSTRESTMLM